MTGTLSTIRGDAHEIPMIVPMRVERFPAQDVYAKAAETIAEYLDAGEDVTVLCEGDPFFYGSFMYLFARLSEKFPTEVVPGVSSLGACSAALGRPLTRGRRSNRDHEGRTTPVSASRVA